ncbi:MAG: cadherin-like domain-containing protein, partial [Calditrichaeota bacterium]|nr:cadherin-like domain-containing protein [Calditrichota bacterium]
TNDAFGNPDRAYSFDGSNDYIRIDNSATLYDISGEFTFAAWIYPPALFANEWVIVMAKGSLTVNSSYAILYRAQGGNIVPYLRFLGSGGQSISIPLTTVTGALSLNQWNFITWRFNAGLVEIFRDGSEIGEYDTGIPSLAQNTQPLDLGRDLPGAIEYYNGIMDEVYLYNRALSDSEIQEIYSYTLQEIRRAIANDDLGTTTLNTPITLNVLRNDFHTQNEPLSIAGFTQPFHGSVVPAGDSTLRYVPNTGFTGNDGFEYIIRDPEDNRDTAAVGISVTPAQADLTVSAVQIPAAVYSGQSFAVSWTVTNQGSQGTNVPEWFDRVYLSESPLFVPQQAVLLGEFPNFSFLLPGEGYQTERSFIMPQGREGTHYIFVQTDARGQLPEIDETNNRRRSPTPIAVSLPDLPDLQVSAVTLQPTQPNAGGSVTLEWTVTNLGDGITVPGQWFDTAFFSRDSVLDFFFPVSPPNTIVYTDPEAGRAARSGPLNPQESYTASIPFTLPHDIESGDTVYFFVHADYDAPTPGGKGAERGAVYEHTADFNNITRLAVPLLGTPPDLEVTDISGYPATGSVAENVPISFTVTNNGLGDTYETNWIDRVYISQSNVFDPDSAIAVGTFGHTGALARFASYTVSNTVTLPGNRSGQYYFHVVTDLNNDVFEGSGQEGNNQAAGATPVDILHPDLAVSNVTAPTTATTGQMVSLSWTVENAGSGTAFQRPWADRVYLSHTPQFNPDSAAVLGSFSHNQPLAPGNSYGGQGMVQIPSGFSGTNWIFVESDWQNVVYEDTTNANNRRRAPGSTAILYPDLEVTEVVIPDTGSSGKAFAVQWSVRNSGSGAVLGSSWRDDLYVSHLPAFDPDSALLVGSKPRSFDLPPDSVYVAEASVTLPNGIQGDYYLFAIADGGNTIFEHDQEGNNRLRSSGAAQIQLSPWADLIVTNVDIPDSANVGQQLRLTYTVQNDGAVKTRSSVWQDRIYVSEHPAWDSSATLLRTLTHDGWLAVGANYTETTLLFLNAGFAGARYFHVIANADGAEYEHPPANANNRGSSDSLQIGAYPPVDLAATILAAPDSAASGATVTLRWRVDNLGLASTLSPSWRDGAYLSPDTL